MSDDDMPRLTRRQSAVLSAFTGILCGHFSDLHKYAEEKLGRPIFTHEFAFNADEVKEAARDDFEAMLPHGVPIAPMSDDTPYVKIEARDGYWVRLEPGHEPADLCVLAVEDHAEYGQAELNREQVTQLRDALTRLLETSR